MKGSVSAKDLIEVVYEGRLTALMASVLTNQCDHPDAKMLVDGFVYLVVVGFWRGRHKIMQGNDFTSFYEACLMDSSGALFRAKISRAMHDYVDRTPGVYQVGSIIRIKDYSLLWLQSETWLKKKNPNG